MPRLKLGAKANAEVPAKIAVQKAAAERKDSDPVVAADPQQGNVVMTRGQAEDAGLFHYKADPAKINSTVAGFNDVQNKINGLATIVNSPDAGKIQTSVAGSLLNDKGYELRRSRGSRTNRNLERQRLRFRSKAGEPSNAGLRHRLHWSERSHHTTSETPDVRTRVRG